MNGDTPFWEDPEVVERFAARDPDHRLMQLVMKQDTRAVAGFHA
jgi:hypothetical protein